MSEDLESPAPDDDGRATGVRLALRWVRSATETRWLVLFALVVRAVSAALNPAILNDSVSLLASARRVAAEGPSALLAVPHQPLPPALIALAGRFWEMELSATALCVLGGGLAVWPLHALARRACGRHAAAAACILYVALPKSVAVGSVPIAEGMFLPFFLGAFALAVAARDAAGRSGRRLFGSGVCAGLAFLCRPEALVAAPAIAVAQLLTEKRGRRKSAAIFLIGFLLLAAPYAGALSADRGRFAVTPKKDVARFVGAAPITTSPDGPAADGATAEKPGRGLLQAARGTLSAAESALTVPVLILVLLGALPPRRWRRRRSRRPRGLIALTALVLIALVLRLHMGWGYGGGRHLLGAAVLLLPFAGEGLMLVGRVLPRVTTRRRFVIVGALVVSIPLLARAWLRPPGEGGVAARRLGEEIARRELAANAGPKAPQIAIATIAEPLVAYYAGKELAASGGVAVDVPLWGRFGRRLRSPQPLDREGHDELEAALRDAAADWLVLDLFGEDGQRPLAATLTEANVIGRSVAASGSTLAAFPILRSR